MMTARDIEVATRMVPARGVDVTAAVLGLPRSVVDLNFPRGRPWTMREERKVLDMFIRLPVHRIAALACRSPEEIVALAERRGVPLMPSDTRRAWGAIEERTLSALVSAGTKRMAEVAAVLSGRTARAIKHKLTRDGMRPKRVQDEWSRVEYDTIIRMYVQEAASSAAISSALHALGKRRSAAAVRAKVQWLRRQGEIA